MTSRLSRRSSERQGRQQRRQRSSRWLLLLLGMLLCGHPLIAQSGQPGGNNAPSKSDESSQDLSEVLPRVSLEAISGAPGDSLMLPLRYSPAPRVELSRLTLEISYISNSLTFVKLSPVVEEDDAGLTTDLKIAEPDEKGLRRATLRITASASEKNAERRVPAGLLAFLWFEISADAKPRPIRLDLSVASADDIQHPPRKVTRFATDPGLVQVELADMVPEISCFFYMH
jgi:hypothetical protein